MHHQAGVNFENFAEVKFRDILVTGTGHRDIRLNRDSPGQTYGRFNLNQNLKPKSNFRFIREKPFAIPSFDQKCRTGALPPAPLVGSLPRYPDRGHSPAGTKLLSGHRVTRPHILSVSLHWKTGNLSAAIFPDT